MGKCLDNDAKNDCNDSCANGFFSLSPCELTSLAFVVSILLAENLDEGQRALLGNFLEAVGVNLLNLTPGAWKV